MNWKSCVLLLAVAGCEMLGTKDSAEGELRIAFAEDLNGFTRSPSEIPDTSDFLLEVTDSKGNSIYDGLYGDCPEVLKVDAGSYVVKVVSSEFDKPEFDAPQYGDEQCVVVADKGTVNVKLVCRQMNAGVKLRISGNFLTEYPDGVLFLKSDSGKLMYGYSEKRTAYFQPGKVSLMLSSGGKDEILMSRTLLAQDMLSLGVTASSSGSSAGAQEDGRISVSVDTTRNWISDNYIIGGQNDMGSEVSEALTVSQARSAAGSKDVWVCGYVVGGDLSSSSASFDEPFSSRTNILLGPKSSTQDRDACLSVQLPAGAVRDALNLVDNPGLMRTRIYLKGDIVDSYYGLPGIKNISEYRLP